MAIAFNNVPQSYRASKIFIELAGVKRSLASLFIPPTGGLIGMYDPVKTSVVDYEPVRVTSSDDVGEKFGFGSHIHRQARKLPPSVYAQGGGIWAFPVPEESAGAKAAMNVTFTGGATSAGTFFLSVAGDIVSIPIANGLTNINAAAALVDEITALRDIPVTATASGAITKIESKFKGLAGNQILLKLNPAGDTHEEQNPAGMTVALGSVDGYLSGGTTDPDIEDVFFDSTGNDKLGGRWYTDFTMPFTDATNIAHHKAIGIKRSAPDTNRMLVSHGGYIKDSYADALDIPATINSKHIAVIWDDRAEYPAFELSAELFGIALDEMNKAPNRPIKTLALSGQFDATKKNLRDDEYDALFRAGMSYVKIDNSGTARLGDIALSYRTNDSGGSTEEWFDLVSLHNRQAKAYSIEQIFLQDAYQRGVLVDNDAVTAVPFAVAPKDLVAELSKLVEDLWAPFAWSKNIEEILSSISAEINSGNNSRVDAEITDDEAKALRIIAVRYAYLY